MERVGSGFCDVVLYCAGVAAILGAVVVCDDLELLDGNLVGETLVFFGNQDECRLNGAEASGAGTGVSAKAQINLNRSMSRLA